MMKQALITGANGFIGQHIVKRLLSDDIKVHILVRSRKVLFPEEVVIFEGDINDSAAVNRAVAGVDAVIHLAGKAHDFSGKDKPEDYFKVNVDGTRVLLESCKSSKVKHFVYFSSVKAICEKSESILDEETIPNPQTPYGESKLEAEKLVVEYGKKSGFKTISLRLPIVYGPGNKGNIYTMIKAIDKGLFIMVGRGDNRRSMVYVGNVVDATLAVIEKSRNDDAVYIVTDGIDYTVKDLYEAIAKGLGKIPSSFYIPMSIAHILGRAGTIGGRIIGRPLPFNSEVLDKFTGELIFSCHKIKEEIGFIPKYNLFNTIDETIKWYKGCK